MHLKSKLCEILKADKIKCDPIHLYSFARDASFYRLIPEAVIQPNKNKDIQALFQFANENRIPLTFRAAGTSLSGQSITNHILVDISQGWKFIQIKKNGKRITLQPSIIGQHANIALQKYGRQIGPDPASLNSCFIGGIVSNNASGMCCGINNNSYHTLHSMKVILPNGIMINSTLPDADKLLKNNMPNIYNKILEIKNRIQKKDKLKQTIRNKFSIKNTMGYSINSFLDFESPVDILTHLMVGSEGTLGFISEVTLHTIPDHKFKATGLLLFKKLTYACTLIPHLNDMGVDACEIMDHSAFQVLQTSHIFPYKNNILPQDGAALLCEFQSEDKSHVDKCIEIVSAMISNDELILPFSFTQNNHERNQLWTLRKGMLPCHAGMRKPGTTLIIEDVCVKVERLASAMNDLHSLFRKYNYHDAVLFGHAKDGNLHFNISSDFSSSRGIDNYRLFMDDVVHLINGKYNGSLKAEHGTGRNMAPFLEKEWGTEATQIMREIKNLIDPNNILNPGVIFTDDPNSHVKNIKPFPTVDPIIDPCIECGFCESMCPSKSLTMTPRRRINILRELKLLKEQSGDPYVISLIEKDLPYYLQDTCSTDGLCSVSCPVNINTGELIKVIRKRERSDISKILSLISVKYFQQTTQLIQLAGKFVDELGGIFGWKNMKLISKKLNNWTNRKFPVISQPMGITGTYFPKEKRNPLLKKTLIYLPSCITRHLQPGSNQILRVSDRIKSLCQKAGYNFIYPYHINSLCCGMPYSSKGYQTAFDTMVNRTSDSLEKTIKNGENVIITDNSPCAFTLKKYAIRIGGKDITVLDPIEFLGEIILPNTEIKRKIDSLFLHAPCSVERQGMTSKVLSIAHQLAENVSTPPEPICCGFAGDLGFYVPELTKSVSNSIKEEMNINGSYKNYCSTSLTCEMGLSRTTGEVFQSLLSIADECLK